MYISLLGLGGLSSWYRAFASQVEDRGSIPCRDGPKSSKQVLVMTAPLSNPRQQCNDRSSEMMSRVTVGAYYTRKKPSLLNGQRPSVVIVTSLYARKILDWDENPQTFSL